MSVIWFRTGSIKIKFLERYDAALLMNFCSISRFNLVEMVSTVLFECLVCATLSMLND